MTFQVLNVERILYFLVTICYFYNLIVEEHQQVPKVHFGLHQLHFQLLALVVVIRHEVNHFLDKRFVEAQEHRLLTP